MYNLFKCQNCIRGNLAPYGAYHATLVPNLNKHPLKPPMYYTLSTEIFF